MKESELHQAFIKYLEKVGIVYIHSNTHRRSSTTLGDPDFVLLKNGHNVSIEFKVTGNQLSDDQVKRAKDLKLAGNRYLVAYSVEEAVEFTTHWLNAIHKDSALW